jgi:DNA processing protein
MKEIETTGVQIYLWQDPVYPALLRQGSAAPPIIYALGNGLTEEAFPLALVGSRRPTYYGEKVARTLAGDLAQVGVTTVSGLARGIDSCVHGETVKHGGSTWAVLGSGLLNLYPRENRDLAAKIIERGALISEFPLHTPPYRGHFPRRNRIIAGLSHATVVIEGDEKSGSLITARLAAEEGRDVFAVPGPIHSRLSRGPHRLIQSGAALITGSEDIFKELPEHLLQKHQIMNARKESGATAPKSMEESRLLAELESTALARDVLAERLKLSAAELSPLILTLELKGIVRTLPGGLIERA